jgi:hypothetical protein
MIYFIYDLISKHSFLGFNYNLNYITFKLLLSIIYIIDSRRNQKKNDVWGSN